MPGLAASRRRGGFGRITRHSEKASDAEAGCAMEVATDIPGYRYGAATEPWCRSSTSGIMYSSGRSAMRFKELLPILVTAPLLASSVRVYVANSDDNKITVIDPAIDRVAGEILVSANPHGIVPSPDGTRFYVSSESKDVLDVVDRNTLGVIRRVPIGTRPNNVAITPDGKHVYVCIRGESWVDIVDTVSLQRVKRVSVGKGPHNVYRTPDGKRMIATSMDEK